MSYTNVIGKPARTKALANFVDYISKKEGVWVVTRKEIADRKYTSLLLSVCSGLTLFRLEKDPSVQKELMRRCNLEPTEV